ncbi:Prolyl oligopeptidase family protein [Shewanella khirikhana]|uniref:Prolyl oligopeptidase family protein n=2 Tax=Shewanella khirikhana TaxID=1965282 RepID=A0ABM7DBG7_9GAMM|nr:prolyl oligopeptidase family serine peptidase [Shewanella khirikhana]AZQ11287.1 Prolyl oligopeptidase family protein [Shewanella khirikhana]
MKPSRLFCALAGAASLGLPLSLPAMAASPGKMTLQDIMQFESLKKPVLADNGKLLAVEVAPDRGDSRTLIKGTNGKPELSIAGASDPVVSADGRYVAMKLEPSLLAKETSDAKAKKKLKAGMVLVEVASGKEQRFERVKDFAFDDSGKVLAIWFEPEDEKKDKEKDDDKVGDTAKGEANSKAPEQTVKADEAKKPKIDKADKGSALTLLALASGKQAEFNDVTAYAFDKQGNTAAVLINDIANTTHRLMAVSLSSLDTSARFESASEQLGALALSPDGSQIAFSAGSADTRIDERAYRLGLIDATGKVTFAAHPQSWQLNRYSSMSFSKDGERIFFGTVPEVSKVLSLKAFKTEADLLDEAVIRDSRGLKLWHGDDPRIKPHEIKTFDKLKKHTLTAVWHLGQNKVVQLATPEVPEVDTLEFGRFVMAKSSEPYLKEITWAGFFSDFYLVDTLDGERHLIAKRQPSNSEPVVSPNGRFAAFFREGQVQLWDAQSGKHRSLTASLNVPFADEDHDYPSEAPGYGFGPWLADESALLVYDKFDIWQLATQEGTAALKLTDGRKDGISYRVEGLYQAKDELPATLKAGQTLLLQGYNERTKADGFYRAQVGKSGVKTQLAKDEKLHVLARAKDANTVIFSRERFDKYPDLYSADVNDIGDFERLTRLDGQRDKFAWSKAELVHWTNTDGKPLDGVLIKPAGYQSGKRYPVLVYFYRFMSDRLHAFPDMRINHRPNFAWYADQGYAVFLPDIRFEIGYPGNSSVQALTSGVQKLIEMGIADPKAVGIQGHSWGGYQTAFAVTQTNIFAAAITGAPVGNMTSAYSGIRHGTGLARQFQYETGQSRIGESLMQAPLKYVENSPVFYADRIKTPMMIMFGDKDDAVPWEQGVELYLAMRRAGKDVVLLQYEGEPHHLKQYGNKLDYSVRMKEYFDHYLKGVPAPEWLKQGEPYREYDKAD